MAVFTQITQTALDAFLTGYGLSPPFTATGIAAGVQNTNYLVTAENNRYVLTLYEDTETGVAPQDLPFFLSLMQHLGAAGISCPCPLERDGAALSGELAGRPAALVSFLGGRSAKTPKPQHCHAAGAGMAQMHLAAGDFGQTRANTHSVRDWPELFALCRARANAVAPELAETIEGELARITDQWPHDLPRGIIHADYFPDNVFFDKTSLSGIIDFYFACEDALAYDVAIALNAWCFEADISFNITKARAFLDGYQSVRRLQEDELAALPVLCSGAAMRFLLTRLHDWLHRQDDALVVPKNPTDYLRRLRFHRKANSAADYGVTG